MDTLRWHMGRNGLFLDASSKIDIERFNDLLYEIAGNIGHVVMDEVYKNLKSHFPDGAEKIGGNDHSEGEGDSDAPSTVERIKRLLEIKIGEGRGI